MKTSLKIILLAISAILCLSFLIACGGGKDVTLIAKGDDAKYICIYESGNDAAKEGAILFKGKLTSNGLKCVPTVVGHTSEKSDFEILFGKTDREASKVAAELLESKISENGDGYHWAFCYKDGKLAIVANNADAYEFAIQDFLEKYLTEDGIVFKDTLKEYGVLTSEEYDDYLDEQERLAAEEKKKEHEQYIPELLALLDTQRGELDKIEGYWNEYIPESATNPKVSMFQSYTEDLSAIAPKVWGSPEEYPIDEHPRLFLTKDNLPEIRKMLREDNVTNGKFKEYVDATLSDDGRLPAARQQSTGYHNHDENNLIVIQAKALAYLLYNDEYYGYQAILYMKNYLASLEIQDISSDQGRRYGYVMRTAAMVYDWCYPLLNDKDKIQFIAGVENCICHGANKKNDKIEIKFPPYDLGAIEGHSCESQLQRDYLSFAVAVYGDNDSWYEYIAGRLYNEFIPFRQYYYSNTGVVHQGTGYGPGRHSNELFAAWIFKVATGVNPYGDSLGKATWGAFNYEIAPGKIFNDGDKDGDWHDELFYVALIHAYVFEDPDMLAMGEYLIGFRKNGCTISYNEINVVAYVALRGLCELEPSEDRYGSMNLIQYNGAPLGQYVVRNSWGDDNAAAVFMRVKERSTAGHEHMDAGTFEIYYKGMLTSDGGIYNNDKSDHTQYFHDSTISHNGLIIYNPDLANTEKGYYSGGQRDLPSSPGYTLEAWLGNSNLDTGKVTGRQHAYLDDAEAEPLYAYIAGDITKAYSSETVEYVGRRMLTVYTGDEDYPMVFFVYDDIGSKNKTYEKRFLLQISSPEEPAVNGKTVITENGEGRLVLNCLSDNVRLDLVGGRQYKINGSYDCSNSKNYLVNGQQLVAQDGLDDGHWGRVEIVSTAKSAAVTFMNVLYVTDKGNSSLANVRKITEAGGVEGGVFDEKIAAVFATDRNGAKSELSFKAIGGDEMSYYVSGVAAGEWKVTVNGKDCGRYTATEEGGLLTFTAPAGSVVITPVK